VTAAAGIVLLYDWRVVTAEGLLELESSDEPVALSDEVVVLSDDVVVSPDELVGFSNEPVAFSDEPVVSDDSESLLDEESVLEDDPAVAVTLVADAVVALVVVPIEPSNAMAPNASAKIASDAATTRLRIRAIRAARARSFSRASSFGEGVLWSGMVATVSGAAESGPGRTRELPGGAAAIRNRPRASRSAASRPARTALEPMAAGGGSQSRPGAVPGCARVRRRPCISARAACPLATQKEAP
jgi:hypothetical protein